MFIIIIITIQIKTQINDTKSGNYNGIHFPLHKYTNFFIYYKCFNTFKKIGFSQKLKCLIERTVEMEIHIRVKASKYSKAWACDIFNELKIKRSSNFNSLTLLLEFHAYKSIPPRGLSRIFELLSTIYIFH